MLNNFKVVMIANDDHPFPDWLEDTFKSEKIVFSYHQCYDRNDLQTHAADADLLWLMSGRKGLVVEDNLDLFTHLKAVVRIGSGTDNIDLAACTKRGIIVGHTPDAMAECTSDHVVAMLLSTVRQIARQDRHVRAGIWDPKHPLAAGSLSKAELGLVGFGRVGRAVTKKLSGFDMKIRIHDPFMADAIKQAGHQAVELYEVLSKSQFIIIACPLTKETEGLIGEKEFELMRHDAVLINCARGAILDEKALIKALKTNRILAAAADVVRNPPLEKDDELLTLDNFTITPHSAGYLIPYPDAHFRPSMNVVIEIAKNKRPQWIANRDVLRQPNLRIPEFADA